MNTAFMAESDFTDVLILKSNVCSEGIDLASGCCSPLPQKKQHVFVKKYL